MSKQKINQTKLGHNDQKSKIPRKNFKRFEEFWNNEFNLEPIVLEDIAS